MCLWATHCNTLQRTNCNVGVSMGCCCVRRCRCWCFCGQHTATHCNTQVEVVDVSTGCWCVYRCATFDVFMGFFVWLWVHIRLHACVTSTGNWYICSCVCTYFVHFGTYVCLCIYVCMQTHVCIYSNYNLMLKGDRINKVSQVHVRYYMWSCIFRWNYDSAHWILASRRHHRGLHEATPHLNSGGGGAETERGREEGAFSRVSLYTNVCWGVSYMCVDDPRIRKYMYVFMYINTLIYLYMSYIHMPKHISCVHIYKCHTHINFCMTDMRHSHECIHICTHTHRQKHVCTWFSISATADGPWGTTIVALPDWEVYVVCGKISTVSACKSYMGTRAYVDGCACVYVWVCVRVRVCKACLETQYRGNVGRHMLIMYEYLHRGKIEKFTLQTRTQTHTQTRTHSHTHECLNNFV